MIRLNTTPLNQYYYIKNNIVYKISPNETDDSCPDEIVDNDLENLPYVEVWQEDEDSESSQEPNKTIYCLDSLIGIGDYYINDTFMRTPTTSTTSCNGIKSDYFSYFRDTICDEQIKETIRNYYSVDYDYFKSNPFKLGVPTWIIEIPKEDDDEEESYVNKYAFNVRNDTNQDSSTITFSQDYFDSAKEASTIDAIKTAGNKILAKYKIKKVINNVVFGDPTPSPINPPRIPNS